MLCCNRKFTTDGILTTGICIIVHFSLETIGYVVSMWMAFVTHERNQPNKTMVMPYKLLTSL